MTRSLHIPTPGACGLREAKKKPKSKILFIYCIVCQENKKATGKEETEDFWAAKLPLLRSLLAPVPDHHRKRKQRVCRQCATMLRSPYLIYRKDGSMARTLHLPSRHIRDERGRPVKGLVALDALAAGEVIPYAGPH